MLVLGPILSVRALDRRHATNTSGQPSTAKFAGMGLMRDGLLWAAENETLKSHVPRWRFVKRALRQFMPGESLADALEAATTLASNGLTTTITKLGENTSSSEQVDDVISDYLAAHDTIAAAGLDAQISVKLTQLGLDFDPDRAVRGLAALAARAEELGTWLWVDMESSEYVERTLDVYTRVKADHHPVGICLQAYLHRTAGDIEALVPFRPGIRLVKGAYKEPSSVAVTKRADIDEAFFRLGADLLAATADGVRVALASHDVPLLDRLAAAGRAIGVAPDQYEVQMLYGIRMADQYRYATDGYQLRTLISYGEEWYPWYVRRLAERPANLGFVARNILGRS